MHSESVTFSDFFWHKLDKVAETESYTYHVLGKSGVSPKPQHTNTILCFGPPSALMESTMNTRSRTRSGVSKVSNTSPTPKLQSKSKTRTINSKKPKKSLRSVLCFCSKDDDGSPMILCSECKIWYVYC